LTSSISFLWPRFTEPALTGLLLTSSYYRLAKDSSALKRQILSSHQEASRPQAARLRRKLPIVTELPLAANSSCSFASSNQKRLAYGAMHLLLSKQHLNKSVPLSEPVRRGGTKMKAK
jgi:hypothetical protein